MREPRAAETLGACTGAFVEALTQAGLRHVCACPGSRSTPLALELARAEAAGRLRLWMHLDERSAAYFGLGLARALDEPVALLATSGTAAANFLPAVVESALARVPLLVLSADRPHELRDRGAPQTIDQLHLYGPHAKWFVDLPEPTDAPAVLELLRTTAARALATARDEPAGPVHVNWPFREPLIPEHPPASGASVASDAAEPPVVVRVSSGRRAPSEALVEELAETLAGTERGLLVCGPHGGPSLASAVSALADRLQLPILADPLSGVRYGRHDRSHVIDAYDAFLRHGPTAEQLAPSVVVRLGALPTSKPLVQYLERQRAVRHIVVDPGGWRDPSGLASDLLQVDPGRLCEALAARTPPRGSTNWLNDGRRGSTNQLNEGRSSNQLVGAAPATNHLDDERMPSTNQLNDDAPSTNWMADADAPNRPHDRLSTNWLDDWLRCQRQARAAIEALFARLGGELFEGRVFAALADLLPDPATVFVGNSMPVRDLDTFLGSSAATWRVLANRGANGIDGVVSSALGASAAAAADSGPLVLVIGDVSFYHDLNGLLAARQHRLDLLVVLLHNDGGGIFSFLPQAEPGAPTAAVFERLFGTPHGLDFRPFVEGYGGHFVRVADWRHFEHAVTDGLDRRGLTVVEVPTERVRNVVVHRLVWQAVAAALEPSPVG